MKHTDKLKLDLLFFSRNTFFLLSLFFLLNSATSLFRFFYNGTIPLSTLFCLFGAAFLPTLFLSLPINKQFRIYATVLVEFIIIFFQTFYDFCFFITGSDITREVLGNLGILQINAAFALWDVWCFLGIAYMLLCTTVTVLLAIFYPVPEKGLKMRWYLPAGIFVLGICSLLNIPALHILFSADIQNDHYTLKEYTESGIKYSPLNKDEVTASPGKNIVHIYLESFDTRFLNEKRFPGLLPNLQQLIKEGLFFSRISNAPLAHYTFGGIYASVMGINTVPEHFSLAKGVHGGIRYQYGSRMPSLLSILKQAGYVQTFLNGPDIQFAGMGPFLQREGVDEILSYKETFRIPEWTCSDVQLFHWGFETYTRLLKQSKPFHLILLTIDTHSISGFPHSRMLKYEKLPGKREQILDLFHTTDFYLGELIQKLKQSSGWKNTCVIITSDHTVNWAYMYPSLFEGENSPAYHIALALNTGRSGICNSPGMTFDMAPTILALAGVRHNYQFPLGEDLNNPAILNENRLIANQIHKNIVSSFMKFRNQEEINDRMLNSIEILTEPYFLLKLNRELVFFPTVTLPGNDEFIYFDFSFDRKINLCRTYPAYKVKILKDVQKPPYYGIISNNPNILSELFPQEDFQQGLWYMFLSRNGKYKKISGKKLEHLKMNF